MEESDDTASDTVSDPADAVPIELHNGVAEASASTGDERAVEGATFGFIRKCGVCRRGQCLFKLAWFCF